jgi:hypothetical protein
LRRNKVLLSQSRIHYLCVGRMAVHYHNNS